MPVDMSEERTYPVPNFGAITTERATALIVIGCLVLLILLRRGFRGLSVPGVGSASIG